MPPQYLLPCENCDHRFTVVPKQAGQDLECPECQHRIEAPKLGQLKQLEMIAESEPTQRGSSNPVRNILFVAGLCLAIIGGAAGAFLYVYANQMIFDVDFDEISAEFDREVDKLTAFELVGLYESMNVEAGLGDWYEPNFIRYNTQGAILLNFAYGLLGLAGLGVVMAISCFFLKR